ncbi:MAG TPA: NrtA/SsuA/CpmA family ABC transporter substrate-binding protein [Rhodopila sp.]|uniref:ABC transporter substrate-binding protein n=1 Tax=Rhodopila sp. TaxID=2480087 RepID=UPI002D18B79B|nr:NrtA/SsuA/CpmA family ABC transporter substrate-binding protein [Rhodopila sp.]HVY17783.1 NrtA/SsuA/CpmA family ABC transporter substrate-binding protein [Rhodopila sp.]
MTMKTHRSNTVSGGGAGLRLSRRRMLVGALAAPAILRGGIARAETVKIRMGALKLIHSITPWFYERFLPAGYEIEIIPFESPTDGKSAVVTKSVDFGTFGIAAAILGAAAHEPVVVFGSSCNKGMAVVARKDSSIATLKDLKGKRVAIWPGSTQEVFILERLRMEGMTIKDVESVRVSFSEMPAALQRGDVDAYVGAEPGPGVSLASGVGKIVEYPYSTAMGSLNMILATHRDTIDHKPDLAKVVLDLQRQASTFAMSHPDEMVAMTVAKLGMKKEAVELSVKNVELNWKMTPEMVKASETYAQHMLTLKQIRALPDFSTLLDTKISDQLAV